jgi:hypothetical protein
MKIPDVWSGQDRVLTVEDMENMPDDEFRYELDDGMLIGSPTPSALHQLAVTRLTVILSAGAYERTAHVIGGEEYRAAVPFPVTIVPSQLVTAG